MKASFGPLQVTLRYAYSRNGTWYYQRPIPKDLQSRYGKKLIKIKLETTDIVVAGREIDRLNREAEADWQRLRAEPTSSPQALRTHAVALLKQWGLSAAPAQNDSSVLEAFFDHLDAKRPAEMYDEEDDQGTGLPTDHLTPVESEAAKLLAGTVKQRVSDATNFYLSTHPKRDEAKFSADASRVMGGLTQVIGDKPFEAVTRADARNFVDAELARGAVTTSIRRRLSTIIAVCTQYAREHEIAKPNPFSGLKIVGEGKDTKDRQPFSFDALSKTVALCKQMDDEPRWITAMIADTGARLAEIVGLPLSDIVLDAGCLTSSSKSTRGGHSRTRTVSA